MQWLQVFLMWNHCLMSWDKGDRGLRAPSGFVTQDRTSVPVGTRWKEAASSGYSCSELSLNNGYLGT